MNTNVVEAPSRPVAGSQLAGLPRPQQLRLAIGMVAIVAIAMAVWLTARQPDWRVLYTSLSDKDGGAVVAQLAQLNVPYKFSDGGGAIMVPADRVHDLRLRLASQGLPKGSTVGFELMENARFGLTQFQERLNFQRGLEGELTRSIQALSSVQSARVHLALPNQNGFFREQQKPSASVLLTLNKGRTLDRNQVAGIVHLVASSVPELDAKAISVVDDAGTLLSSPQDAQGIADQQQLQYAQSIEQMHARRILDLLEPVVGRANVKAQVTAEIDFSQSESTVEQHKPNQLPESAAVRSQQVVENGAGASSSAAGIPGAASNQPPSPTSAPINGGAGGTPGAGTTTGTNAPRRESVTNYEVDKTVRVVRVAPGAVRRINAAVVVNYRSTVDASGKAAFKPLTEDELGKISAIVREAVGYNKDRGDSINVMNTPFVEKIEVVSEMAWWQRPEVYDIARLIAWPAGLLALSALVIFTLIRPAIKSIGTASARPSLGLDAMLSESPGRPAILPPGESAANVPTADQLRLEDARRLARSNPVAVASIVKTWVSGDAAA